MKRRIVFLMLLTFIGCGAMAQNDAMYIYRNDGEFNAFLKADIDSIAHSCYDADSILHVDKQMHVIYTPDSIYRIPLAVIDSISFVTPEPVLNDRVFELTAAHDAYLSDCDTIRFTLSLDTPSEMCPSKGDIVVSTYDCLSFPDGIMGCVLSKTQNASGIHYNCEKVGLEDVYEHLTFIGECYVVEEPLASGRRKVDVVYERELWNMSWTTTLEKGGTTTTLNIGDAARMKVTVNIQKLKPTYFRLDLTNELTSSIKFNATNSFEKWYEKELVKKMVLGRIPIPGTLFWITPKFGLSGYFAEGATVSLDCNAHFNRTDKVSFEMKNKRWNVFHTPKSDAGVDVASLSMQGYMEVGLIPDLQFTICGSATGLGIEATVGVKETVDFKFDAVAVFDEDMYSAMRDSYARTTMPWSVRAYVQFGLFGDNGLQPASIKASDELRIGTDKYLLPLFTEPGYEKGANSTTAVLKTEPSRDLLLPVQLGMSFYEGAKKLETKYLSTTYRNQSQWTQDGVQIAFNGMEAGKTYTAYPTVKIMGKVLRAVPSINFPEPIISFIQAEIVSVDDEVIYNEDGEYLFTWYTTKFKYLIKISGADKIDYIQPIIYSNGTWTYNGGKKKVPGNGLYSVTTTMSYDHDANMNWGIGYCITLKDGSIIYTINTLQFGGTPESPTIEVCGSLPRTSQINRPNEASLPTETHLLVSEVDFEEAD